jgi:uncharacterized protein
MLYREMGKTGDRVSILGYGCMRFPRKGIGLDEARTERQIISAIEGGVNYFDTAYLYPGSETLLGNILAKGYRDKVFVATKLPSPLINSLKDMESTLTTSLKRLKTDHVDYYLVHTLMTNDGWQRLKQMGAGDFLEKARAAGKIRHIGFSYHGDRAQFRDIVDDYPWEFCQIQFNYLDEHFQAGVEGLQYAASKGLGVIVMEPLRGGLLVKKMPPEINAIWERASVKRPPAEWALRWVWDHPEVSVVLSGMNAENQVVENIRAAENALPDSLSSQDRAIIGEVRDAISKSLKIGCTGCGYCMPCPAGVNIPQCFMCYNNKFLFRDRTAQLNYITFTTGADSGASSYASLCRKCGKCEEHCPQHLPIRDNLRAVSKELQPFYFGPIVWGMKSIYRLHARGKHKKVQSN